MLKATQFLRQQKFYFIVIPLFLLFQQACKKLDTKSIANVHDNSYVEKFFIPKNTNNKELNQIIAHFKAENDKQDFIGKLPYNCGLPIWDKLVIQKNQFNTLLSGGDSLMIYIIPLTISNTDLSSVLIAKEIPDGSLLFECYTTNDYLYQYIHINSTAIAKQMLSLFFYMENRTYGTTKFYHIPADLGDQNALVEPDGTKTVEIKGDTTGATTTSGFAPVVCTDYPNVCPTCHHIPCDIGVDYGFHTVCVIIGMGGGGGSWPPFPITPPGGAGGNGGGTTDPPTYPTGSGCTPLDKAWYSYIILPTNPCDPPTIPQPVDTILAPCADAVFLQTSPSFLSYMQELKDSINGNREYGYFLARDTNNVFGNTPNGLIQGPPNKLSLGDFSNIYIIDCIAHLHFNTNTDSTQGLSVFSPDDLITMCDQFNAGNFSNPETFSMVLVTKNGTQYLLKIENLTKFRAWSIKYSSGYTLRHSAEYQRNFKIWATKSNTENEKLFLKYLQEQGGGSGLKLFRGNSNFTQWDPIMYNNNTSSVVAAPCQ